MTGSCVQLAPIRLGGGRTRSNHLPGPGLALDRRWRIVQANKTAAALYGQFGFGVGDSLIDLMVSDTLPDVVENWPVVAQAAAARLRVESLTQGGVAEFDRASAHLAQFCTQAERAKSAVIPTIVNIAGQRLSMFATIAQIGTPEDVMLDDFKIELYFPMDDETETIFEAMGVG